MFIHPLVGRDSIESYGSVNLWSVQRRVQVGSDRIRERNCSMCGIYNILVCFDRLRDAVRRKQLLTNHLFPRSGVVGPVMIQHVADNVGDFLDRGRLFQDAVDGAFRINIRFNDVVISGAENGC